MADGALNVTLSDYTAAKLADRAVAMGLSPEELAALILDNTFFDHGDFAWPGGDPRQDHARNHDLNEPGRAWNEVRPELLARMERQLAGRE